MLIYILIALVLICLAFIAGWRISERRQQKRRQRDWKLWLCVAGDLTHQMGTPLSALMGWLDLLPTSKDPSKAIFEMGISLDRLRSIAVRLAKVGLIGRLEKVSLGETIEQTRAYFLRRIAQSSGIVVSTETEGRPVALGNQELLTWVLEGLVKNAVDAIEGHGGRITLRARQEDGRAILEVEDTGMGISPDVIGKIFDPGFSTKMGGRGMGLALAHHVVVTEHQGRLTVARTGPGQGTLIRIELEAAADE